ncbi:hypothetical protein [Stenotrophomonas bentonitica]|uniref:Uncharacterized protein n=1 Tax=Stenotrophomonas bentonitica TaxID=1450134 RepID=A0ABU9JM02_9GAMM
MDQLIAKITNLGYEVWGIFIPGLIFLLFMVFAWWCAGPVAGLATFGFLAPAEVKSVTGFIALLNEEIKFGFLAGLAVAAYFSGHLLHWVGRSPKGKAVELTWMARVGKCLTLSIPKSPLSYDPFLEDQLAEGKAFLEMPSGAIWQQFYPVAKAFLAENLQSSLVSTYQNKYTLHRALAAAAVVWFWLTVAIIIVSAVVSFAHNGYSPKWFPLLLSPFFALAVIYGFSDSYQYNWKLFGNTLITETYTYKRMHKRAR